tara:strand:+ start:736 stop:1173 length:438 start_codon:yes stop_codon:yes gene_type:complete
MKPTEIYEKITALLNKHSEKEAEAVDEVALSKDEAKEVELADEAPVPAESPAQVPVNFATVDQLSELKQEFITMFKQLIEEKSTVNEADVPAKLSAEQKEELELSQVKEEVVHSPEVEVERKSTISMSNAKNQSTSTFINEQLYK